MYTLRNSTTQTRGALLLLLFIPCIPGEGAVPRTVTGDVTCDLFSGMPVRMVAIINNLRDGGSKS